MPKSTQVMIAEDLAEILRLCIAIKKKGGPLSLGAKAQIKRARALIRKAKSK